MKSDNRSGRIVQHLRSLASGQQQGARLPSVRQLMRALGAGPVTISSALKRLSEEGMIEARPGQGTFVAAPLARGARETADLAWQTIALGPARASTEALAGLTLVPTPGVAALNAGYLPEELQANALIAAAARRALRRPGVWGRMPPEGLHALRAWFAAGAGPFAPHEITICPGTQAALSAAFRALALPGEAVLVESPTYIGALAAARAAGLRPIGVPIDEHGLAPDLLETTFRTSGARLLYCQPAYANPTGAVLSHQRRAALLGVVRRAGAFIIEDDWARDFPLDAETAPAPLAVLDTAGHAVLLRSLTKCAAPGLRIGAVAARGAVLERLRAARLAEDFFVPGILQETAVQLLTQPAWPRYQRALRLALRERRDALVDALQRELGPTSVVRPPAGGLHLWVRLPDGISDLDLSERAARAGILVSPGRHWFPAEPPAPHIRLSFAALPPEQARPVISRLAALIRRKLSD